MYSPTEVKTKLQNLTDYVINQWNSDYNSKQITNSTLTVFSYAIDTSKNETEIINGGNKTYSGADLALFRPVLPTESTDIYKIYDNNIYYTKNYISDIIDTYIQNKKTDFASLVESFIKEWYFYHDFQYTECENDTSLGLPVYTPPTYYWSKDWTKLFLNGTFDFKTIMETTNEDFYNNMCIVKINIDTNSNSSNSSNSSDNTQVTAPSLSLTDLAVNDKDCDCVFVGNMLSGFIFKDISHSGWDIKIPPKRDTEISNFKQAITDMQNATENFTDNGLIDLMEDRGDIKSIGTTITQDNSPKNYNVIIREVEGDTIEQRYGNSLEFGFSAEATIQGLVKMIYLPSMHGLIDIIKCTETYNKNDFTANSMPISTRGSGKIYIPSYLKQFFKEYVGF